MFQHLIDIINADLWVTRNNCGWFPGWIVGMYVVANLAIWLAYESIPFTLKRLSNRGVNLLDPETGKGFIVFIQMCGRGHLLENVLVFVYPNYLLFACWHLVTAIVSISVAVRLTSLQQMLITSDEKESITTLKSEILRMEGSQEIERLKELAQRLESFNV